MGLLGGISAGTPGPRALQAARGNHSRRLHSHKADGSLKFAVTATHALSGFQTFHSSASPHLVGVQ